MLGFAPAADRVVLMTDRSSSSSPDRRSGPGLIEGPVVEHREQHDDAVAGQAEKRLDLLGLPAETVRGLARKAHALRREEPHVTELDHGWARQRAYDGRAHGGGPHWQAGATPQRGQPSSKSNIRPVRHRTWLSTLILPGSTALEPVQSGHVLPRREGDVVMIAPRAYLRWRNASTRHPYMLAAQRKERARIRSEKGIRCGRHILTATVWRATGAQPRRRHSWTPCELGP